MVFNGEDFGNPDSPDLSNPIKVSAYNAWKAAGSPGGGSSSGSGQISSADLVKLREQAYNATQSYYEKLAKESKGDFDIAVKLMTADYTQGVRQAKERLAYTEKYGKIDLENALSTLGLGFGNENESLVDTLNKRGMAVYEGEGNVVKPASFTPSFSVADYTVNPGVGISPTEKLGRGGTELSKLRSGQALRAEALMRAKMQPLEQAGLTFKQYTNPQGGFNPNNLGGFKGDLSMLGTAEQGLAGGYESAFQNYRNRATALAGQRSGQINEIAGQAANTSNRTIDQSFINQI